MQKTETSLQSIAIADLHYTPDRRDMTAVDAALPENVKGLLKKK